MRTWLAAAAAVRLMASFAAHAQTNHILALPAREHPSPPNYTLREIPHLNSHFPLTDGMIAREEVAPNVHLGLGLAPMLGRRTRSVRIEQEPVPTRNPGVTLVFKFPE